MKRKIFLLLAFMMLMPAFVFSASKGDILITEISPSSTPDYVEIQNVSGNSIDVNGWIITDIDGTDTAFVSAPATLADGDIAVIRWEAGTSETDASGDSNSNGYWDFYCADTALTATDDQGVLKDDGGIIIDAVDWTNNDGGRVAGEQTDAADLVTAGEWTPSATGPSFQDAAVVYGSIAERNDTNDTDSKNDWTGSVPGSLGTGNIGYIPSGDTIPPEVSSTNPANGVSGIAISQDVIIDFSEEMADTSTAGITIAPSPGGESYLWSNNTATLTISHNDFTYSDTYTVILDKMLVTDLAGNTLALSGAVTDSGGDTYSFFFTTGNYGDGTGTAVAYPKKVALNNYQTVTIVYTADLDLSDGQVSLTIPGNWTQPQDGAPTSQGYVSLGGDATADTISITAGWEIIVDITTLDTGNNLIIYYGDQSSGEPDVGAQCDTTGTYPFIVRSKGTGTLSPIATSPDVEVYETISGDQILISSILVDSTAGYEYVELYNPGPSDIDLTNYWWGYYSGSATDWTAPFRVKQFNDSGATIKTLIIPSCGYYLIAFNDDESNALDDDAQYYTSAQLANAKGALAIFPQDPGTYTDSGTAYSNRFDAIGWGGHALNEGTATSAPATDSEMRRKSDDSGIVAGKGNGYDTDNNSNDFEEQAGAPKNSTSPAECPPTDYYPPTVLITTPNTAVNVNTDTDIVLEFSEEMDTQSVTIALNIEPSFSYTTSWTSGETITITPSTPLSEDTEYIVTVSDIAMDIAGNSLDGDNDGNPGGNYLFSFHTIDNVLPNAITDLTAASYPTLGGANITFTAPGDNGTSGQCDHYEIAYSTSDITSDTDFINADKYDTSGIVPQTAGETESIILTLLPAGTTFYISAKGVDESNNESPFGNTDSAISGSYGVSKYPNIPLAVNGNGDLALTYTVGAPKLDGDDTMYVIVHSSFTQPNTTNISVLIDDVLQDSSSYTVTGTYTIEILDITANDNIKINFIGYDFPSSSGNYNFQMRINKDNNVMVDVTTPDFVVMDPILMTFDPAEDPHTAPGKNQAIIVNIRGKNDINLYGASITATLIDSPIGATITPLENYTDTSGNAQFALGLSATAGKHIVQFDCETLTDYFIDTSFEGEFLSTPYPNPAGPDVETITFEINIQNDSHITLSILSLDARKVVDVVNENFKAGYHLIKWDLKGKHNRRVSSGIYFALLKTDTFTKMKKFSIVR